MAITRHGRPAAFLVSPQGMEDLLDARRRRSNAVAEFEEWIAWAAQLATPDAAALTDEQINQMVHDAR